MRGHDEKPDSSVAYGAAMDGVSAVITSVSIVGRYWWNVQMQLLQKIGIMPLFKAHWWLFFVVGFLLLAFLLPLGTLFVISAFCAGEMDPNAKDDFIVPLRREERDQEYVADADIIRASSSSLDRSGLEEDKDKQEDLYVAAGIGHMTFLNAMEREVDDAEFSAAALGAFDGTVQGLGIKLSDVEMFIMGSTFILRQIKALERLDEVDPERIADLTADAMDSQGLRGIREQAGHVAYSISSQIRI